MIAAGAFEPFYLRMFTMDRERFRASLVELPYRKLPGLRALLVEARARTREGDTVAIYAPYGWDTGYEYAYARALYPLAGRRVVLWKDVAHANWIAAYGGIPEVVGFRVVWRDGNNALMSRGAAPVTVTGRAEARLHIAPELIFIAIALIVGFGAALLIDRHSIGAVLVGESLLFGIAIAALLLAIVPWSRGVYLGAILVIAAGTLFAAGRVPADRPAGSRRSILGTIVVIAILFLLLGYALFATAGPLWEFDFLVDWGLKAKSFFIAKSIDWRFLEAAWYRGSHPDYPPLLPLAFDAVTVLRSSWSDRYLGLLNVAFAGGMLLIVYRLAVEEVRSDVEAAFITFAMVPLAASPWIGIAEAPFAAYATAALLLIRKNALVPGSVMLGLAALTKNEGAALIVAIAMALALTQRLRDVPRLWPAVVLPLPWWIARSMHHLSTDVTSGNAFARIVQHATDPALAHALASYSLGKPLFWMGLLFGIALMFRKLDRFVMAALAIQLAFYIGAYLATPHDVGWHVQWSWERLISHLTPALTFVVLTSLLATPRPQR